MTGYSTKGVSPKMRGAIVAVIAASSSLATSYVETGDVSRVALGALVGALFSAVGVWFGGVGNVEPDGERLRQIMAEPMDGER